MTMLPSDESFSTPRSFGPKVQRTKGSLARCASEAIPNRARYHVQNKPFFSGIVQFREPLLKRPAVQACLLGLQPIADAKFFILGKGLDENIRAQRTTVTGTRRLSEQL